MGKNNHQNSYTIYSNTYALVPYVDGERLWTRVIEDRDDFLIEDSIYRTVSRSCAFYRGSLESATLYSQKTVRAKHKPPIIIGEYYGDPLVFFPTHSPKNKEAVWLNYDAIDLVENDDNGKGTNVHFCNGEILSLDVSPVALRNQHSSAGSLQRYFRNAQKRHHQMSYVAKRHYPPRSPSPLD